MLIAVIAVAIVVNLVKFIFTVLLKIQIKKKKQFCHPRRSETERRREEAEMRVRGAVEAQQRQVDLMNKLQVQDFISVLRIRIREPMPF